MGDFLIERTDKLFKFMVKSSIWARLLRRFVLPRFAANPHMIKKLAVISSQTAIRYEEGAICDHSEHAPGSREFEIECADRKLSGHFKPSEENRYSSLCSGLFMTVLFFMPKNVNKKLVKQALNAAHYVQRNNLVKFFAAT